jgi:hypothetical protein
MALSSHANYSRRFEMRQGIPAFLRNDLPGRVQNEDAKDTAFPAQELRARPALHTLSTFLVQSFGGLLCLSFTVALLSCQSLNYAPPVTSQMTAAKTGQHVDLPTLREGRTLFVHRCIECHTLPPLWHYRKEDWPEIVNSMSQRASLNPAERDAIISYILAVRAQH